MKRFLFLVALLVALVGTRADALTRWHYRAAQGEIPSGSNCSRVTVAIPNAAPYTAIRCPTTGGAFVINSTLPTDATTLQFIPITHWLSPDSTPSGNFCHKVCGGVVLPGQSRNNLDLTACSLMSIQAAASQYVIVQQNFGAGQSLRETSGSVCSSLATCSGQETVWQITRVVDGVNCSGNSAQNMDFLYFGFDYQ